MRNKKASRNVRKKTYIRIKNHQRYNKSNGFDYNFVPVTLIHESRFADIFFIDPKDKTVWNAEILSAVESIDDLMFDEYLDRCIKYDKSDFEYFLKNNPIEEIQITNSVEYKNGFSFGNGVSITLAERFLTLENVSKAVTDFLNGEFIGKKSVTFNREEYTEYILRTSPVVRILSGE